jgi:hypothetical protein
MHDAPAQNEHRWLQQFVGDWMFEVESQGPPGQPASRWQGIERVRPLGELWILCEGEGEMPGSGNAARMLMTLGYDPARERFVGSWVGSMMTHFWVYEGRRDQNGQSLTLDTQGPSMTGDGKLVRYREVIELHSADHRIMSSHMLNGAGEWHRFMTVRYRRRSQPTVS